MSTKTTLKRIALVAVSAMGLGILTSVAPASAVITSSNPYLTPLTYSGTATPNATQSTWVITHTASTGGYVDFTATSNITSDSSLAGAALTVTGSTVTLSAAAYLKYAFISTGGTVTNSTTTGSAVSGGTIGGGTLLASSINPDSATGLAASLGCTTMEIANKSVASYTAFNAETDNAYRYVCAATGTLYVARNDNATKLAANIASADAGNAYFRIGTSTPGTITATLSATEIVSGVATATTLQTFQIVASGASSAYRNSTTTLDDEGNGWLSAESDPVVYAPRRAGQLVADIQVEHLNSNGNPATDAASPATTFSLSGVGTLEKGGTFAGYIAVAAGTDQNPAVNVYGDGRAGTATITVAANGTTIGTHTIKFYGNATKVEAVGFYVNAKANDITGDLDSTLSSGPSRTATVNNDPAIAVLVTDALGTPIPALSSLGVLSTNLLGNSSNPAVVPAASVIDDSFVDSGAGLFSAGALYNHIAYATGSTAKSGEKATLTFSVANASDASIVTSNPIEITIGGAAKTVTMTTDKATYAPGEKGVLTITAKDSSGNPAYDGSPLFLAVSTTTQFGGSLPSASTTTVAGQRTRTFFAPVVPGEFSITGTLYDYSTVSAKVTVVGDTSAADAALEAIDAANAATDAANLAAEAADAATVAAEEARDAADAATAAVEALAAEVATLMAALKAQITALANVVAKIAKKIKA